MLWVGRHHEQHLGFLAGVYAPFLQKLSEQQVVSAVAYVGEGQNVDLGEIKGWVGGTRQ